jgi:hypothetical protein
MINLFIYFCLALGYGLKFVSLLLAHKEAIVTIIIKTGGLLF